MALQNPFLVLRAAHLDLHGQEATRSAVGGKHNQRRKKKKQQRTKIVQACAADKEQASSGEQTSSGDLESLFGLLDDFLLIGVFEHLHHAPTLDRLRGVCARWRAVVDANKYLWKELVWREFEWKKTKRKAKGARKQGKMDLVNYREHYIQLFRQHKAVELANLRLEKERTVKISRLMRTLVRYCYQIHIGQSGDTKVHPWLTCMHQEEWLQISDAFLKKSSGSPVRWCGCKACGATLVIVNRDLWLARWPTILDVTSFSEEGRSTLMSFARHVVAFDLSDQRLEKAFATYEAFRKQMANGATHAKKSST